MFKNDRDFLIVYNRFKYGLWAGVLLSPLFIALSLVIDMKWIIPISIATILIDVPIIFRALMIRYRGRDNDKTKD